MPTYNGWPVITMPTDPACPASLELAVNAIVSVNTNPFTAQQQTQDWQAGFWEGSVSMQSMTQAQGQIWAGFFASLNGIASVFQFSAGVCALFPVELTTDGTTPRYWRLRGNQVKWSIKAGPIYSVSFEIREAK